MKACLPCGRGFHDECLNPAKESPCCCNTATLASAPQETLLQGPLGRRTVGESAGRKEAARLYPLDREGPCEWRGLANVGGGINPIVGCINGLQQNIHHGPVKNTTENSRHNIHLICAKCHNTWHAKNDSVYDELEFSQLAHKPRVATDEELIKGNVGIKPKSTEPST